MTDNHPASISRRHLIAAAGVATLGRAVPATTARAAGERGGVRRGNIKQSIVQWCFNKHWKIEQTCRVANQLGVRSVELIGPDQWGLLQKYGLVCAIAGSHGFVQGMNNPDYHGGCQEKIRASIDACADAGFRTVISFTGFGYETGEWHGGSNPNLEKFANVRLKTIAAEDGIKNCVKGFKEVAGYAEKKGVRIAIEMLNSRVDEHMKGHPGYQGDHIDYCMEIINQVGSPNVGLLFDIYHVQIMDGDIIRRVEQCQDVLFHVHTAGNPGRRELDDQQEINYPPILRAILATGYDGYVGQEFIPTGDPLVGLKQAVELCDV